MTLLLLLLGIEKYLLKRSNSLVAEFGCTRARSVSTSWSHDREDVAIERREDSPWLP